jgi:hypothetical protein
VIPLENDDDFTVLTNTNEVLTDAYGNIYSNKAELERAQRDQMTDLYEIMEGLAVHSNQQANHRNNCLGM